MLLVALGPACGGLVPVASDRAARLRLQFQPGQVFRFRTELRGVQVFGTGPTPPGLSMQSVTDVTHRVVSVDRDEGATLEVDADPVSATTNGQEVQLRTNPEPWQIVVAAEGAILDSTRPIAFDTGDQPGEGPDVQTNPTGAINPFPHLATGPVTVGTGWSGGGRAPSPFGGGTVPFQVRAALTGYELVGTVPTAVVVSRVEVTLDVTVPAGEYLEGTEQTSFDLPADAALDYDGELRYVQRAWLHAERGQVLRTEIVGSFATDVAWTGVPAGTQGFEDRHVEGSVNATTERTG